MNNKEYLELVKELTPKVPKVKNAIMAFLIGGIVGFIGEIIIHLLQESFGLSRVDSYGWLSLLIILFATFMTAIGKFDDWVSKYKCGLIVPTTGFAHSIQSASLDYKREGFIKGIGSNTFKLAGSVIVSGIVSAFIFAMIMVVIYG